MRHPQFLVLLVVTHFILFVDLVNLAARRSDATGPCSPFGCRHIHYATKTTGCSSVMLCPPSQSAV
jgi:hypothetical protein